MTAFHTGHVDCFDTIVEMTQGTDKQPSRNKRSNASDAPSQEPAAESNSTPSDPQSTNGPTEIGGQAGPEPTRYGDWEKNGRCTDF